MLKALAKYQKWFITKSMENYQKLLEENLLLRSLLEQRDKEVADSKKEILNLHDLIIQLRRKKYGSTSEKTSSDQLGLFNEVELEADRANEEDEEEDNDEKVSVSGYTRSRGKRSKLPDELPREEIVLDLEDKTCANDNHELKCIGEEVSEKLEIIPAKLKVIRIIKKKYCCPDCEKITIATAPPEILPKSNATASLLAYIANAKYSDALPLSRQESIFARMGIELPRQTMARWMIKVAEKLHPLITLMREELLRGNYIQMDETTVQVLKEKDKKAQTKSYMWVQARLGVSPIILFHYGRNRSADHPRELLEDFQKYLQIDGYDGYAPVIKENGIIRLGCWSHARRKFFDAFKSSAGESIGKKGLIFFRKIYQIEDEIKDQTAEDKFHSRLVKSIPIVKEFKNWVDLNAQKTLPNSIAGQALRYTQNEWDYLINCFTSGEFRLDNNYIENHIRPFTIGRKNWLFADTPQGAMASANIYSLIETAKANKLDTFDYLKHVFTYLPQAENLQDFLQLLPFKSST